MKACALCFVGADSELTIAGLRILDEALTGIFWNVSQTILHSYGQD